MSEGTSGTGEQWYDPSFARPVREASLTRAFCRQQRGLSLYETPGASNRPIYHSHVNLSARERQLLTTLAILLIILASFQILANLSEALSRVADVVLIFVAAWALSFLLGPLVNRIDERTP